ncbi:polycystin-1-like [Palaemon carinicauda]|uniref:polycystin-1-like n=1 Tax=Palaemon carinicauda TaxID=392227 RepID=UPI0035B63560
MRTAIRQGGDLVDGVKTSAHHYATAILKENVPVQMTHICTTVNLDVTLEVVDFVDAAVILNNVTSCERIITDIDMKIHQLETDTFNASLNVEAPFYIRTLTPAIFTAMFSVAGPVLFTYTYEPDHGSNHTFDDPTDYPFTGIPYEVPHTVTIPLEGVYTVTIHAENKHNIIPGPVINTTMFFAQHEVVTTWTVTPDSVATDGVHLAFLVDVEVPMFKFIDTAGANFPTNASVQIDWGDGTAIEVLPFINPGDNTPIIGHPYINGGVYALTAYIYNKVSGYTVTCEVLIVEQILDFTISNMYFPNEFSVTPREGFGVIRNQFPMDRNLTFFPVMSHGTVDTYEIQFTVNGSQIFTFTVVDRFMPTADFFYYHFNLETLLNLTVTAVNIFERVPVDIFVEILEQVKLAQIDDFAIVTGKEEEKEFKISFETLGGGTCLVVDWGDTDPLLLDSFGDEYNCMMNFSFATFHPDVLLSLENTFMHTYLAEGVYNISIMAYNPVSVTTDMLMFIVSSLNCRPPIVDIFEGTMDYLAAPRLYRGEDNSIVSVASVDCDITSKTKKRWQIFSVDDLWGFIVEPILTMDIIPTWNMSEIVIPATYLTYGRYALTYTLTMWDPLVLDPALPFQKQMDTFIEIIPTPLKVSMFGGILRITRGLVQEILFDPSTNSIDPDYPEQKNFSVSWRCRELNEAWPATDNNPLPIWPKGTSGTGCFGYGPGLLDYTGGNLTLLGDDFIAVEKTYEIEAIISKDTRTDAAIGQVHVVPYNPPILEVKCLAEALCTPDGDGVIVNPSLKMGILVECIDYCAEPYTYEWTVFHEDETQIIPAADQEIVGNTLSEYALKPSFFDEYENEGVVKVGVEATDPTGIVGGAMYFLKINKRPINGYCSIIEPPTRLALVDMYKIECGQWVDPENKGITVYSVFNVDAAGKKTLMMDMKYSSAQPNSAELVFGPGVFDIVVEIHDKLGAFTVYTATTGMEVLMPTQEQIEGADIAGLIQSLSGAGNTALLTMVIAAQTSVNAQAPWLSLNDEDIAGLSQEEIDARILAIATANNEALDAIKANTVYNSLGSISAAASTVAGILKASTANLESLKTIDLEARDKVADISEDILGGLLKTDPPSSDLLIPLVEYMGVIAGGMAEGQKEVGSDDSCQFIPPSDFIKRDTLPFDTRVTSLDMVTPEKPEDIFKCNVRDITKQRAQRIVPLIEKVLDRITESVMSKMVAGETYSISTDNDIHVMIGIVPKLKVIYIGDSGSSFTFPDDFCPQINCNTAIGYSAREWPFVTHAYPDSSEKLSPGTKTLDLSLYTRKIDPLIVKDLSKEEEIIITIPRISGKYGNDTLPDFEYVDAVTESASQRLPIVYTTFHINKTDSAANLEILPDEENPRLFLLISKPRLPTVTIHEHFYLVKDIPMKNGVHDLFLSSAILNGTGRYFIGIGEFKEDFDISLMNDPVENNVTGSVVQVLTTNYKLRVITCGCYFLNKANSTWLGEGLSVISADHGMSNCSANHLTSFGSGMFVMPNTIDFNYVFANMGFNDNLTIYLTLIISLSIFLILLVYAHLKDKKDVEKLGATPLPDNKIEDMYFYEMLVFTGNVKGAQTESLVQFTVAGENDETDVRTLADSKRKILRKGAVDVFVMAVPRPLGPLQFLHIWHDNGGKGVNASWYLSYVVFRDVQSGDKYEFICHQWLAVEHDDGQIDRLLEVAGPEQRVQFSHLYNTTKNKNIADGHLWFSVFLRPARSRFTRCQRVASCFALLFLSMLVNAMWYDRVPEQPGTGGLNLGPFSLSPEQIGVGLMSNLIVFPPSFLIVFIFRKSQPKTLRKSRIEKAYERTRTEQGAEDEEEKEEEEEEKKRKEEERDEEERDEAREEVGDNEEEKIIRKKVIEKKSKNKKFVLPWWMKYIAWLLVILCIGVSCFFLLMYGIMFGNSKATKWITSLVISFFSSVLFIEPLKIFLTSMLVSAIFKSVDLDEDDADEDEEEPNLEQDEMWLHQGGNREKTFKAKRVDNETLQKLRSARKKEVEMWSIIKEIAVYSIFIYVLLILSYGNRDPNAFFLKKTLQESFIHEGAQDDTDFTLVNNADRLWKYFYSGFMTDLRAGLLYNGKPPYGLRGFFNDWCNRVMGYAIIRQIRIKEDTCRVPHAVRYLETHCSGFSGVVHEDNEDYCKGWVRPTNETKDTPDCNIPEFKYESAEKLESSPIWGERDWYGGGGYVIHLKESIADIFTKFRELHSGFWIDSKTRAVLIEFSSYNSQVNLFGLSLIMAEFTPGGGINPSFRFEGIRLLQHHSNFGLFVIFCEVVFVLFVIYFTFKETRLFYKMRRHYFDSYWSYAEIAIIIASYIGIILYVLRYFATDRALKTFQRTAGNGYVRIQYASNLNEFYSYIVAFLVFTGTIKLAKLLRFNKRIGVLSATLHQCWDDLSGFLMAFFLCFCSFVMMFYVLLSMSLEEFCNFITAIETCFAMMLGKFSFEEMKEASMMVPIMFFVFVVCNSWVLINLLLTLIIRSFQQVKHDIMRQPNEYEMVAFIWGRFRAFLGYQQMMETGPLTTVEKAKPEDEQNTDKVNELPNKVDKFLDYMNQVYFSGALDVNKRDSLKNSLYNSDMGRKATAIPGSQSAFPARGMSNMGPVRGSANQNPTSGPQRPDLNKWHGVLDEPRAGNAEGGVKYEGPRITNKFQAELDDV